MKGLLEVGFDVDAGAVVGDLRKAEPLWRETGDGHGTTLVVTDAGLLAIGVETVVVKTMTSIRQRAAQPPAPKPPTPRAGTKQAQIIAMLQRPRGASVAEMVEATSWQVHTVRGAISGALKKRLGLPIVAEKVEGKVTAPSDFHSTAAPSKSRAKNPRSLTPRSPRQSRQSRCATG